MFRQFRSDFFVALVVRVRLGLSRWFRCGEALNEEPPQLPIEVLETNSLAGRAKKKENPRDA